MLMDYLPCKDMAERSKKIKESLELELLKQQLREEGKLVNHDQLPMQKIRDMLHQYSSSSAKYLQELKKISYDSRNHLIEVLAEVGTLNPKASLEILQNLLNDDLLTRQLICSSLTKIGHFEYQRSKEILRRIALDKYPAARTFVAEVMGSFSNIIPQDVLETLQEWAFDNSIKLKEAAILSLGACQVLEIEAAVDLCEFMAKSPYSSIRKKVSPALAKYFPYKPDLTTELTCRLLEDNRWEVRVAALEAIALCVPSQLPIFLRRLRAAMYDEIKDVAMAASNTTKALAAKYPKQILAYYAQIAKDKSWLHTDILRMIIRSLDEISDVDRDLILKILHDLRRDEDVFVRSEAYEVIKKLRSSS